MPAVTITSSLITGNTANSASSVRAHVQNFLPMGKLLTCLPRLTLAQLRTLWSTRGCVPQRPCKVPIAPREDSRLFCSFLQGGGVIVSGGRVAISSCTISGNTVSFVRVQKFPSPPPWETHVLLFVCRAAVSMSRVAQCPCHRATSLATATQLLL